MPITLNGTTGITTPGLINTGSTTFVDLTTTGNTILGDASTDTLNVANGNLVLNSSGNAGLGVTPVASFSGYKTFQIASQGVISSDSTSNGELEINNNAYRAPSTATLTYINSFAATKYAQYQGQHRWFNAPSGTAGNTVTFTQAMTLDASGNLIVADTSQQYSARLYVSGSIAARNGGVDGTYADAFVAGYTGNYNERNIIQTQVSGNSGFRFNCSDGGGSSGTTTSMSVTKNGVIVSSNYVWQSTDGNGKGFLLGSSGSANGLISQTSGGSGSTATYIGNAQITTSSDVRLKENIVDSQRNALKIIDKIRVVDFTWNDPSDQAVNNKASRGVWTGLIAQEAVAHIPWLINKPTEDTENGKPVYWTVDYGHSVPFLIKAIQELKSELDSVKTELAALKGN